MHGLRVTHLLPVISLWIACAPRPLPRIEIQPAAFDLNQPFRLNESPQAKFAARVPKPIAPFDTQAWYAKQMRGWHTLPRIPLPGGRFAIGPGMGYETKDSVEAAIRRDPRKTPFYLESTSPEAADKIILYAFSHGSRVEIQDTLVRLRYGPLGPSTKMPDTATAFLTRSEKESLDSALTDLPAGLYYSTYLIDCDGMGWDISAYGIKRIQFGSCMQMDMAPDNPLVVVVRLLESACRRQGLPDITSRRRRIGEEE